MRPTRFTALTAIAVLAIVIVGCDRTKAPGDHPKKAAGGGAAHDTWTHKELADHLRAKGIVVKVYQSPSLSGWPSSSFAEVGTGEVLDWPTVDVLLCPDRKAASERAASDGDAAFAWGRFSFHASLTARGDYALLAKMKSALQ